MRTQDRQNMVRLFRTRLVAAMESGGFNQSSLARQAGVDRSTLSQLLAIDNDRLPRADTVAAIAMALQVSVDWLMGLSAEARLGAAILKESMQITPSSNTPTDEGLVQWHNEAVGYKIRYVPNGLPDLMKSEAVLRHEYRDFATSSSSQAIAASERRLAYTRMPDADMEICAPRQIFETFASGVGLWQGLTEEERIEQFDRMIEVLNELYPKLRLFLFDGLTHYAAPYTVFGPKRAVIYIGQMYYVFNTREHVRSLTDHFDNLVRCAVIQANEVAEYFTQLKEEAFS